MSALAAKDMDARLDLLRQTHGGSVDISQVGDLIGSMVRTMQGELELTALKIGAELKDLMDFISAARLEISSIQPNALSKRDLPGAADELDAIVAHTEAAASEFMDAADEINAIAEQVDPALAERLQTVATRIFEASSFQDITGQRVTKVVKVLKHIEEKLTGLAAVVGDNSLPADEDIAVTKKGDVIDEKDLLNGPQLAGAGNGQDDIDALLASFD
jgi:chemotaxis protein CheZ